MGGCTENCPIVEQAVGWALHALEPDEEAAVEAHVPGCAICRAAVRDIEEVVAGLGAASDQVEPLPDLERVQNSQAISDVLNEIVPPGTRHAVLATADGAVVLDKGERQVLTVGMTANPSDHTYVLWGVAGQAAPVPLGTFDVNAPDVKKLTVGSGADKDGFTAYAVSLEPGRTAPAAPSSVMAEGRLV